MKAATDEEQELQLRLEHLSESVDLGRLSRSGVDDRIAERATRRRRRRVLAGGAAAAGVVLVLGFSAWPSTHGDQLRLLAEPDRSGSGPVTSSGPGGVGPTTATLVPGAGYADCSGIRAGDPLGSDALGMVCDPAGSAALFTVTCLDGEYVHLRRPEGDLEGITGRTAWQKAGEVDPQLGRTPFAFQECKEH